MAQLMKDIRGTNNAFEFSETITTTGTETVNVPIFIPSNVAVVTMGVRRTSGTAKFKVQISMSTIDEVNGVAGEDAAQWFDWQLPGIDANGYLDDDEVQYWVPIPSHMRFAVASGDATSVYFSIRAN